ncbi:hypothetical protein PSY47_23495, partial [Shigella flexneri]|nr:hypothetical protein [Shigella flexneri]
CAPAHDTTIQCIIKHYIPPEGEENTNRKKIRKKEEATIGLCTSVHTSCDLTAHKCLKTLINGN